MFLRFTVVSLQSQFLLALNTRFYHTFTYYVIVSIYRTSKNSPTLQYVNYSKKNYILQIETSPLYNGEVNASVYESD